MLELSLGEGFDLAPCEALWKRTPVVGAPGGGLPLVVRDGVDGFLADEPEELAARLVELVRDPGLAAEMGRAGRERVRERFLVTAALERELRALGRYCGGRMKVTLPDGSALELPDGATGADAAAPSARAWRAPRSASARTASCATSTRRSRTARSRSSPPSATTTALWLIRHDAAHVLATAVMELYPGVKISIGPPIEDGFYYDFEFPDGQKLTEDDFERIEAKMREHIKADEPFERTDIPWPRRSSASGPRARTTRSS